MALTLYAHPFSSYCQKVLVALWENEIAFGYRHLEAPGAAAERAALWPLGRFPVLVDNGATVVESSIIIEHLELHRPGPVRLLPTDPAAALEVRLLDRFFDSYVMDVMTRPVAEALRAERGRPDEILIEARAGLDLAYAWAEERLRGRTWAAGADFSMADCAAAPALFYADWVQPIGEAFPGMRAYRAPVAAGLPLPLRMWLR